MPSKRFGETTIVPVGSADSSDFCINQLFECAECTETFYWVGQEGQPLPNFCPLCGRKVSE
jgi:hypothetical protein